jgi:hypothetical protein
MDKKTFSQGMAYLSATFPALKFLPDFHFEMLEDLDGELFAKTIKDICQNQTELYPNSNIIAIIRKRAVEIKNVRYRANLEQKRVEEVKRWELEHDPKVLEDFKKLTNNDWEKNRGSNG